MIFVTVGTHEQQFDRLIKAVDKLWEDKVVEEEVIIQTGYSKYEPKFCEWSKLYTYQEMIQFVTDARIVITHGGPSSFIMPLQIGKVPIVVPRQKQFGEHVNDHQVEFCRAMAERQRNIIVVEEIQNLREVIVKYDSVVMGINTAQKNNNIQFIKKFESAVEELMQKGKKK